jgi:hypothetical protein
MSIAEKPHALRVATPLTPLAYDDDEPITITEIHGTVARFDMVVEATPGARHFGLPFPARLPSALFLVFSLGLVAISLYANYCTVDGPLFEFIVEGDRFRAFSSLKVALFVSACAMATVVRTSLQGVTIDDETVMIRSIVGLGIPRIRRFDWVQIDRLVVTEDSALLELWNGDFERLPDVAEGRALVGRLVAIARERRREVTVLPKLRRAPRQ